MITAAKIFCGSFFAIIRIVVTGSRCEPVSNESFSIIFEKQVILLYIITKTVLIFY